MTLTLLPYFHVTILLHKVLRFSFRGIILVTKGIRFSTYEPIFLLKTYSPSMTYFFPIIPKCVYLNPSFNFKP